MIEYIKVTMKSECFVYIYIYNNDIYGYFIYLLGRSENNFVFFPPTMDLFAFFYKPKKMFNK